MIDEMFRNKAMTVAFSRKPVLGEVGWKVVGGQPTEHICTKSDGWVTTADYIARKAAKKAANVAYFARNPHLLANKIAEKRSSESLLRRAYSHGRPW